MARTNLPSLRVLLVAAHYPPLSGGIGVHVEEVARRLAKRGFEPTVLTTDRTGELPAHEWSNGVAIRRVRAWPPDRDYYFAPGIYGEITRGDWDLVHVHSYLTFVGPLAMLAALRAHIPYVVTFHAGGLASLSTPAGVLPHILGPRAGSAASRLRYAIRPAQLALVRPLLARADRLVALAPFEIDVFAKRLQVPRTRFALISNGSDLPRPTSPGPRDDALIVSVGRLERYKGHHRVLSALPHIARRRTNARLLIAGSGPYEPELRRLASELGVGDRVEIREIPPDHRQDMANELSRARVVTLLSDFEGAQPLAALEALSVGCRLVVTDAPGLSDLADQRLARAIPLDSTPEAVAAVILEELDSPTVGIPIDLPTWDECADALHNLYVAVSFARGRTNSGQPRAAARALSQSGDSRG